MILKDKIAVVTGVSKGIGEALCRQLLSNGSKVYGLGRNDFDGNHNNYTFIKTDVRNLEEVKVAFDQILSENNNCIDILINVYLLAFNVSIFNLANNTLYNIYNNIRSVFGIFSIINIVIVIIFINKLKEINCECSEDIVREVYWIYNIVLASYIGIAVLLTIMAMIMIMSSRFRR
jgi:short-subunit dehydrogenase involved in D-alanine esterification of teichoic acids